MSPIGRPAKHAGARAVNSMAATLTVVIEDNSPLWFFNVKLGRGQNVTGVARGDSAAPIQNRFGTKPEG